MDILCGDRCVEIIERDIGCGFLDESVLDTSHMGIDFLGHTAPYVPEQGRGFEISSDNRCLSDVHVDLLRLRSLIDDIGPDDDWLIHELLYLGLLLYRGGDLYLLGHGDFLCIHRVVLDRFGLFDRCHGLLLGGCGYDGLELDLRVHEHLLYRRVTHEHLDIVTRLEPFETIDVKVACALMPALHRFSERTGVP